MLGRLDLIVVVELEGIAFLPESKYIQAPKKITYEKDYWNCTPVDTCL